MRDQRALVVEEAERHARRKCSLELRNERADTTCYGESVRGRLLDHPHRDDFESAIASEPHAETGRLPNVGDVAQRDHPTHRPYG